MTLSATSRRWPAGAEPVAGGVHFRVWAPDHKAVAVVSGKSTFPLESEANGYHSGLIQQLKTGDLYKLRLPSGEYPDPASRFQPEGVHGPSQIVDPSWFRWTDTSWSGIPLERAVIYELHIGTFTREGTWRSAAAELPRLKETGVTVIEVMPVAEFPGRFGWGYDGVDMYAPTRLYGSPDDMRSFVDRAHALGIAVVLDVVYNHLGADGNYLAKYTADYFSPKHTTDWGEAINYDGVNNGPVREFFISNAGYWIDEFHLDGLRLDATQNIYDDSEPHILREVAGQVRKSAQGRHTLVIGENEPQHTRLVRDPAKGGYGLDALWNDDLHHTSVVAMTGHNDSYYTDYLGSPQEFISGLKYGYLYQGQRYKWQKNRRGTPAFGLSPSAFVNFIENHDQVANSARGLRIHRLTSPGIYKALTVMTLLGPGTPMMFQGQEFASSANFEYFADVPEDLAELVRNGRKEFLAQWRSIRMPEMQSCLKDPCSPETFERCKLDSSEREKNRSVYELHMDLLRLRREDPVFSSWRRGEYDGAVLGSRCFLIRAFREEEGDRLILMNLGLDLHLDPAPEPLLAPPLDCEWKLMMSTEDPAYGGCGTPPPDTEDNWRIPGQAAIVLRGVAVKEAMKEESK